MAAVAATAADDQKPRGWPAAGLGIGGGAMALSDSVAAAVGATDPTTWGAKEWLLDVGPHAAYGLTVAATLEMIDPV